MSEKIDLSKVISGWNEGYKIGICNPDSSGRQEIEIVDYIQALRVAVVELWSEEKINQGAMAIHRDQIQDIYTRLAALEAKAEFPLHLVTQCNCACTKKHDGPSPKPESGVYTAEDVAKLIESFRERMIAAVGGIRDRALFQVPGRDADLYLRSADVLRKLREVE